MTDVLIFGAGGFGSLVQDILAQGDAYRAVAFLDSNPARHGRQVAGLPVLGGVERLILLHHDGVGRAIVAIGDNVTRMAIAETLRKRGFELISAIHPLASISPSAEIGGHVVLGPRATICVHTRVGPHTVLSAGAIADHDNVIGQAVFLHPAVRLAGGVTVGDFAVLGIGACVIPGRKVGAGATVGPGAVVIRDVPAIAHVSGVPAAVPLPAQSRFVPELAQQATGALVANTAAPARTVVPELVPAG
ncbi:MAG: acetyltransferase [Planctomycetota bacterium]